MSDEPKVRGRSPTPALPEGEGEGKKQEGDGKKKVESANFPLSFFPLSTINNLLSTM